METSFKHYTDGTENGPEIINVTGVATGATILPPDQVLDVTRRSSMAAPVTANKPVQVRIPFFNFKSDLFHQRRSDYCSIWISLMEGVGHSGFLEYSMTGSCEQLMMT